MLKYREIGGIKCPTYNIHERFDWDNPNNKLLWELAGKYGTPYFANFLNSDLDISDVRSMCPMTADTRLLVQALGTEAMEHMTIGELYANVGNGFFYEVWTGKRWVTATPVVTEATDIRAIKFDNGTDVKFGINHLQPTRDLGTLPASALTVGMWVPFYQEETPDQIVWRQIVSIEENTNTEPLYCLEVEDDSHIFMLANGLITHNCRLRLDLSELRKKNGGLFGAGDSTGSVGVVTINLPRIAYENKGDEDGFFKALAHYCDLAKDSLEIKRDWLQKNIIDTHAVPAFIEYVGTLDNHFSTIGEVGRNEACENFLGADHGINTPEGKEFALKIGEFIRAKLVAYQEETGHLYNYEATPAESTSYRLALGDRKDYDDIITQGSGKDCYYTNSCHIPVSKVESINETFKHQEELQAQYTGGTVIHCYLEGAVTGEQAQDIVKAMLSQYKVPYMSLSPISRYCPTHGYVNEIVDKCPICKAKLKKYQRITGYLRCVDNFNRGKAAEFKDRKQFALSTTKLTDDTN